MTQIEQTKLKIANLKKLAKNASTWTEKCMIENTIEFLERDLKYLGASS